MEGLGIISRVNEPTPWCAAMVVVPKQSRAVHICVDMKPLNENILREVHPMPKVNTTLAQLTGATIFSKLDGFWQIPLAKESPLLRHMAGSVLTNCQLEYQVHQKFFSTTLMTSYLDFWGYYAMLTTF